MHSDSAPARLRPGPAAGACALLLLAMLAPAAPSAAGDGAQGDIQLELSPRICTLSGSDKQCDTLVRASWHSPRDESLCLVVVERPEVKRCWEKYSEGTYSIELLFAEDLEFQLKDAALQHVMASEVLRVIREAIRYRHKRREPWNIFD
jgi:hypothetical protein